MKTGKMIETMDGKTSYPTFGEVYTAAAGGKGYVAGYKNRTCLSQGLMGAKEFASLRKAQDYAVQVTQWS